MNNDMVNHPAHYEGKYECKEVMLECFGKQAVMDFYKLCAFKYLYRCMKKHETPNLDIEKAHWYLGEWIKLADDELVAEPVEPEKPVEDDFDQDEYTLVDDNHSIRVPNSVNGIIAGLRFKGSI